MSPIPSKQIEVFCGTGGVGKTTLSTSRALFLALQGKRVLLITIDPARRLKEILQLKEERSGEVETIPSSFFQEFSQERAQDFSFDALLMSPAKTLATIGEKNNTTVELENPIIKILTRPHGGMNEILAILEVQHRLSENKYDHIILDTPPGKHFIDFLQSSEKIKQFFDKSFIDIFNFLGKRFKKEKQSQNLVSLLVKSGIKKLLSFLEKVTGKEFVDIFIDAIVAIYNNKHSFLEAISFQEQLRRKDFSNWFLVTSVEQQKAGEAHDIQQSVGQLMHDDNYMVINKSLAPFLESWTISESEGTSSVLYQLKTSMEKREQILRQYAGESFESILSFPEVLDRSPKVQVIELAKRWGKLHE